MQIRQHIKKLFYGAGAQAIKNQVSKALRGVKITPSEILIKRLAFNGVFTVPISSGKSFKMQGSGLGLENRIFWKGLAGHEPFAMQVFLERVIRANWFVDIGSNSGLFSLVACGANPTITVIAFEPMPLFFNLLKQNIELNSYPITPYQVALSEVNGTASFYFPAQNQGNLYSASLSLGHFYNHQDTQPEAIEVVTCRFDDLIDDGLLKGKGIIKIDAEGHGIAVLKGMEKTIEKLRPVFIIEVLSLSEAQQISKCLPGYSFFGIQEKVNTLTKILREPYSKGSDNYLCIASEP